VSPAKYKLGFYIPEDGVLYSHRRENLESYRTKFGKPLTALYVRAEEARSVKRLAGPPKGWSSSLSRVKKLSLPDSVHTWSAAHLTSYTMAREEEAPSVA
jgi:hypothetical protein